MTNYEILYLTHAGILGMRWGIRRFQNKDGSLTPAGKKRYDDDPTNDGDSNNPVASKKPTTGKIDSTRDGDPTNDDRHEQRARNDARKRVSDYTDAELKARIDRMAMEDKYVSLSSKRTTSYQTREKVETALKVIGTVAAVTGGIVTIAKNADRIKKIMAK